MTDDRASNQRFRSHLVTPDREERRLIERLQVNAREDLVGATRVFARIVWSRLCEPGDSTAYKFIAALGEVAALETLINDTPMNVLHGKLRTEENATLISERELSRAIERWKPRLNRRATLSDLETATNVNATIVTPTDMHWPEGVDDLEEHAPLLLWVRGHAELLCKHATAVVGARASSAYGEQVTTQFTHHISRAGSTVISGGAYGIDAVAHRTALGIDAATVAVMAGGIDRSYPAGHEQLLRRIAEVGAICSEVAPGTAPTRWRFLQRNRLIAALSSATLVTEAGIRSGSLNTAGHASQLGRPLGAVPGPITAAGSQGCFALIRDYDALMITSADDLDMLMGVTDVETEAGEVAGDESGNTRERSIHVRVTDALPLQGSRSTDQIARSAGLTHKEALHALLELELLGSAHRLDGSHSLEGPWSLR